MSEEFSVFESGLVPEHILLSDEEKKQLLEELGIKLSQLPRIYENDPAAKELGAKPKDVIKIIRKTEFEDTIYYRVVVKKK